MQLNKMLIFLSSESNGHVTNTEHHCKKECHLGDCGPCDGMTKIKCRCGSTTKVNLQSKHSKVSISDIQKSRQTH